MPENRRKLSIALVAHAVGGVGGMEIALAELVRRAHDRHRLVVFATDLSPELRPLVEWRRIVVPRRPIPLKFALFFALAGTRLARARVDLVHTIGAIVPNRADVASVHHCHAAFRQATGRLSPPEMPLSRRLNTALARSLALVAERWCYRSARLGMLAAVSQGVVRELRRHYPSVDTVLTPNGVDPGRFRPDDAVRRIFRESEGVGDDETLLLFVGGNWDHKGLEVAIQAVAAAAKAGSPRCRLWVVGRGDEQRFTALATRARVGDRVRFFGPRTDTERFYQAADIFVLPTLYEAASLVGYEAAACGLPILATRTNGLEDLIGTGDAGLIVERTAESVGAAIVQLASVPAVRRRMSGAALRIAQGYTWERSVGSVLNLYEDLAARIPARGEESVLRARA